MYVYIHIHYDVSLTDNLPNCQNILLRGLKFYKKQSRKTFIQSCEYFITHNLWIEILSMIKLAAFTVYTATVFIFEDWDLYAYNIKLLKRRTVPNIAIIHGFDSQI